MSSWFEKLAARPQRALIGLSLLLLLAGNWILPLTDRDEARFSEASREMIQRADYVVPWFNGEWRFDKPVFIYWCQIASYRLLGDNDFAARLPSVLFTTATALLLFRWGRKLKDIKTGLLAGAMYVTALHVAILGRIATADMAMIFFFTLVAWSGWELIRPENPKRRKWWWTFYIALALGFLAKGPVAWLPLAGIILGRCLRKKTFRLPLGETLTGLSLSLALVALWGGPALAQTGGQFWAVGMGKHVIGRSLGALEGHGARDTLGYLALMPLYFLTFFASFLPWSLRTPKTLLRWWPERKTDDSGWYLLMNAALVFVVFSLVKTKLPHYTMPAFPLIALWLAREISSDAQAPLWFTRRLVAMVAVVLAITLGLFSLGRSQMLTFNLWKATQAYVTPASQIGCFGYTEPSLVWRFREVSTNLVTLGDLAQASDFLSRPHPRICVVPTRDLAQLADTNGIQVTVRGLDVVKFKYLSLTAIIRP